MNLGQKRFRAILSQWSLWIVFGAWLVLFFPKWYFLSYTKIRELRDLAGESLNEQRVRLHTPELSVINDVVHWYSVQSEPVTLVIPPVGTFPQLSVGQLWEAVALSEHVSLHLARPLLLREVQGAVVFFIPSPSRNWQPTRQACWEKGCECPQAEAITPIYWEVP